MADYSKLSVSCVVSENSDYREPYLNPKLEPFTDATVTNGLMWQLRAQITTGTTLTYAPFATVAYMVVKNKDTTNYVDVTITKKSAAAAINQRVAAGKLLILTDIDPATAATLTANTADVDCEVIVVGTMT